MTAEKYIIIEQHQLPSDKHWLGLQTCPVIAYGDNPHSPQADVLVASLDEAKAIAAKIEQRPLTAMTLVQVLRSTEVLPISQALDVESLAYSTLQNGPEFAQWLAQHSLDQLPQQSTKQSTKQTSQEKQEASEPILLTRDDNIVELTLNRANSRNAISIEMRDALVEALMLLSVDTSIEKLRIKAAGACFSIGGDLQEFGSAPDATTAHWVRTVHSPARLMAQFADKIECTVHGACIGSGLELPAFASRVIAKQKIFFQLPELKLGLIPGAGGTVSIARRIGRQRTAWLVLTGKKINAQKALEWGLIDEVVR